MIGRTSLSVLALLVGVMLAALMPGPLQKLRSAMGLGPAEQHEQPSEGGGERAPTGEASADEQPGVIKLTEDQMRSAGIAVAAVQGGTLTHRVIVPGTIVPAADRIARIAVKIPATVAELRKRLGDTVVKDEVVAALESRDVADAKSEYLAARLANDLQQTLFERAKALWDKRISTEQDFLRASSRTAELGMRFDIARQKLFALGLGATEIAGLADQPETTLRRLEIRSPMTGRIVERKVDLGMAVGRDNLETELYVVADLARVWVDLAVGPADLPLLKEGQAVSVGTREIAAKADGKIMFISPMLDKETRSARVVAEIDNRDGLWRPGSFVTAAIAFEEQAVPLAIPAAAIQTMDAGPTVFVRTPEGFRKRPVVTGRSDDRLIEVVSGLRAGETIAVSNTFSLKAELLKALAED
jgi:membrane fusion protein, heavy metal efflux system